PCPLLDCQTTLGSRQRSPGSSNPKLRGLRVGISCLTRHRALRRPQRVARKILACRRSFSAARCYDAVMMEQPAAMHVARIKSSHTDKQGRERVYESRLLRRTYRDGGKVRHETLANLSKLPDHVVDAVEAALKGEVLVPGGEAPAVTVARSVPH